MNKLIEIFKPGKHTAMNGVTINFTEEQLKACAAAYSSDVFESPLVVGHPKLEDAAYGWVKSLSFADGLLLADLKEVDAAFAELVNAKKFPKVSASFYLPDSPNNPMPGVLYLKHVGFLGAAAPAVKGLKTVSFAADEEGVVEFTDWDKLTIVGLFRNFRDFMISKFGMEEADKVLPTYQIDSLQISAVEDDDDEIYKNTLPSFSENDEMTPEQQAKFDAIEAENKSLKTQVASFAEAEVTRKKLATHTENVSFAEGLVKDGKLLPANKDATIALMDQLAAQDTTVEFGEGTTKIKEAPLETYKKQLASAPKLVEFGESARLAGEAAIKNLDYQLPQGASVDNARLELHHRALEFAEKNECDYVTAVKAVEKSIS